ncbi:MAG: L,D-transpeptidase family protein, partial [Pseudomonadota bacterium]
RVSSRHSPYKVRQAPGAQNALGQVKFMFPNQHSVYLHDTPSRNLFSERVRTFSSGCVRVEHPMALASAILGNNGEWATDSLESSLASGETTNVTLDKSLPVHLVYLTAWVDESGRLQFRNDVYNRDANLQLVLNKQIQVAQNSGS